MMDVDRIIKKAEALSLGLRWYFTGKPCKRGHIAERRVGDGICISCEKIRGHSPKYLAYKAEYRSKNTEKCSASHANWRRANADKVRADHARYYTRNKARCIVQSIIWISANRDKSRAFIARWKKANPDRLSASARNRYARIMAAEGTHSAADVARIRSLQKDKCAMCRIRLRGKGQVDHIMAVANGGSNWPRNLQILCKPCNLSKNARHPIIFAQKLGLLL